METNYQQMNFDDYAFLYVHVTASGPVRELRPGDRVKMVGCAEAEKYAGRVWTVTGKPWTVCGSRVVKLEGFSGGFDCERLELVKSVEANETIMQTHGQMKGRGYRATPFGKK